MIGAEVWGPLGGVAVAALAYAGGRSQRTISVAQAWQDFLGPLQDELAEVRERLERKDYELARVRSELATTQTDLLILRRHQAEDRTEQAVTRGALIGAGLTLPEVPAFRERTRRTDPDVEATGATLADDL